MKRIVVAVALTFLIGTELAWGMGKPKPTRVMVAMGDSMTAGTFANTTSAPGSRDPGNIFLSEAPKDPVNAMLDPQSRNFGREFIKFLLKPFLETKGTYSWATGRKILSHFRHLQRALELQGEEAHRLEALNISVPGSKAIQVLEQARRLDAELGRLGNPQLEYLAMTVGADDACVSTAGPVVPDAEFETNVRLVLRELASSARRQGSAPDAPLKILVAGIPSIPDSGAQRFWDHPIVGGLNCRWIRRKVFPFCPNLLDWTNASEYADRLEQVKRKNEILSRLAQEANEQTPELQVVFGSSLTSVHFEPEDLALDCFHPNAHAQVRMSEALWQDQPWY